MGWKVRQNTLKDKLKFVIKALTDKDANYILMAYNQLKQRKLMLEGVGLGDDNAQKLKIRLLRRLTNTGFNLQCQAANSLKEFLASERAREEAERLEFERQQREKDRILMLKQRGIMRRIVDKNARMVSAGYNKLIEEWKVRQNTLKEKLKFVIKALTDKDAAYILAGY